VAVRLGVAAGHTVRGEFMGGLLFDQRSGRVRKLNTAAFHVIRNVVADRRPDAGLVDLFPQVPPQRLSADAESFVDDLRGSGVLCPDTNGGSGDRFVPAAWRTGGLCLSAPRSVFWEITSACTVRDCIHCYSAGRPRSSFDGWAKLVDDLANAGVFTLDIGGGEPLLYPHLAAAVNRANARGLRCNIATSLYSSGQRVYKLAAAVHDWGVNTIQVSLDGSTPAVHNAVRGRDDAFQVMAANLKLLAEAGIAWSFSTTVMAANLDDVANIVARAHALGGRSVRFVRVIPSGRGQRADLLLSREDYRRLCSLLADLAEQNRGRIRVSIDASFAFLDLPAERRAALPPRLDWLSPPFVGCGAGRSLLAIGPDGSVWPCAYLGAPEFLVGSVHQEPLLQMWRDSPVLRRMRNQQSLGPVCDGCELKALCQGGCRAAAYGAEGSVEARDPGCWRACP
jgi:radical SAM protein with 4Fe4S-binding SPASM domain